MKFQQVISNFGEFQIIYIYIYTYIYIFSCAVSDNTYVIKTIFDLFIPFKGKCFSFLIPSYVIDYQSLHLLVKSFVRMIYLLHKRNNQGKLVVIYATHDYVKIYK